MTKKLIDALNKVLKNELTAINQYFLHSKILEKKGINKLAAKEREESMEEMVHADKLIDRILFLDGIPNLSDLGNLLIGKNVSEILKNERKVEEKALKDLSDAIEIADANKDYTTSNLLEEILASEEEHIEWLDKQFFLMEEIGVERYIQTQV